MSFWFTVHQGLFTAYSIVDRIVKCQYRVEKGERVARRVSEVEKLKDAVAGATE